MQKTAAARLIGTSFPEDASAARVTAPLQLGPDFFKTAHASTATMARRRMTMRTAWDALHALLARNAGQQSLPTTEPREIAALLMMAPTARGSQVNTILDGMAICAPRTPTARMDRTYSPRHAPRVQFLREAHHLWRTASAHPEPT
jgi:hypothetical protein